jgi:hypothetical protein
VTKKERKKGREGKKRKRKEIRVNSEVIEEKGKALKEREGKKMKRKSKGKKGEVKVEKYEWVASP